MTAMRASVASTTARWSSPGMAAHDVAPAAWSCMPTSPLSAARPPPRRSDTHLYRPADRAPCGTGLAGHPEGRWSASDDRGVRDDADRLPVVGTGHGRG